MTMREEVTKKTYDVWSKVYDGTFGALVRQRQARAIEQLKMRLRPGHRVLDIGVGTGLTLPLYPSNVHVVGMDLSAGMLAKAAEKCRELGLGHCKLVLGDAMFPPFADGSFDHVIMCHTISVVSDPARLLNWANRLVKPEGSILVLNHFQSVRPWIATVERIVNPLCTKLGWRSDLVLEDLIRGSGLNVEYMFKVSYLDLWQIVSLTRRELAARPAPAIAPTTANDVVPHRAMPATG